ncbi:sensor histidine kinase [Pelosinus propionicus]|uniref:Two-component system, sensor histidine kinase YesM n=1 Tax=Pelosinus propionicus DSM 13327 TaxID=1123291 RepID=A0A1I4LNZ9_9FIRM|nr:histidine kinase [Pelosinus propionicus]SFL92695.1 two-component system, sensor histidine kinase YesM [Pelosinus propionicus DSM 13327]
MRKAETFKSYMKRLFIRYTVALILLMFILFIIFIMLNFRLFVTKANEDCNQLVGRFVSEQYISYQNNIERFSQSDQFKKALLKGENLNEVNRELYQFCLSQQIKSNFVLLRGESSIVSTNLYKTNQMLFLANGIVRDVFTRLNSDPGATYSGAIGIPYDNGQKSDLMFARAIVSDSGQILGYLIFGLQEDSLSSFMRNRDADIILITDRFNNVIFSTNSLIIDSMGKYKSEQEDLTSAIIDQKPYYVTNGILPEGKIKIITMTSIAKQQQLIEFGVIFLSGMSCFLIMLVRVLADKVTTKNLRSIDELLYAVSECRTGNIHYRIKSKTFDEFQTLYDEFNNMMIKVQQLIKNNDELAERKRWMEVKHLKGQFNPHFMFNVMETLRYVIAIDPNQASQMVVSFANLMRYSINYGSTHVSLKTDISYVKDYLLLQKMRYNQRLEYNIEIEEALLQYKVPKLFIQPIVENSIVHGLENTRKLRVQITGRALDQRLALCIEDDGPGISEEALTALRALLNNENAMPKRIGLYNVHRTAQLLYGKDYGLNLESLQGKGLRVTLTMPIVLEDDDV